MNLQKYASIKDAAKAAAQVVAKQLKKKPESNLGLGGGESLVPVYEELVRMHLDSEAPFNKFRSFQVCEFLGMPGTHPMSYRFFLIDNFLDHVPAVRRFQKRLAGLPVNMAATCKGFEDRIKKVGGIDILLLELGVGDWIGFNEKGIDFDSRTHELVLSEELRSHYATYFPRGSVPRRGLTMGIKTIMEAKKIIVLAGGSERAPALTRLFTSRLSPVVPSTALKKHPDVTVYCDAAAASELPASVKRAAVND